MDESRFTGRKDEKKEKREDERKKEGTVSRGYLNYATRHCILMAIQIPHSVSRMSVQSSLHATILFTLNFPWLNVEASR